MPSSFHLSWSVPKVSYLKRRLHSVREPPEEGSPMDYVLATAGLASHLSFTLAVARQPTNPASVNALATAMNAVAVPSSKT